MYVRSVLGDKFRAARWRRKLAMSAASALVAGAVCDVVGWAPLGRSGRKARGEAGLDGLRISIHLPQFSALEP